jgi:hypothetical protein
MLLSSGQACGYPMRGSHAKYGAFAYSSAYAYSVPTGHMSLDQYALASQLGLSDDGGETWRTRRLSTYASLEYRGEGNKPVLVSSWKPFPDVVVKTFLVPPEESSPNWHIRAHRIEAGREVMTADGSFAIRNVDSLTGRYLDLYDEARCEGTSPKIIGNYDNDTRAGWSVGSEGAFAVSNGAVGIKALELSPSSSSSDSSSKSVRRAMLVNADPNSNLVDSRTTIPTLQSTISKGETVWYVSAIYARPSGEKASYLDGWSVPPAIPEWLLREMELRV